ncbi:MAG: hypothetical protein HQL36_05430 [Alphaproteobacteria bacterium]|nr:hypothetical protein [Alphaproteobacteria bacterium]MBF0249608.1 hypothetical protein [Alphaproteobacteria bacterium]
MNRPDGDQDNGKTGARAAPQLPPHEDGNPPPDETGNPLPEQRADFVVKRLEQFIREGRTLSEGMSLRQWQDMARMEITLAIIAAENAKDDKDVVTRRVMFTLASALVTIGFWGTVFAFDKAPYLVVAFVFTITGIITLAIVGEWQFVKYFRRHQARQREKSLRRVEDLTRRIKRMEKELQKEHDALRDRLKEQIREKRGELVDAVNELRDNGRL